MGCSNLEIVFDRENRTYRSGELVTGKVLANFTEPVEVRDESIEASLFVQCLAAISLKANKLRIVSLIRTNAFDQNISFGVRLSVAGKSRVKWSEKRGKYRRTYTGQEIYFSSEFSLLGNESGGNITLPIGELTYPFNVQLPTRLPNSFEHKHGFIRYTVEVTFDRPWKFDYEARVPFDIVSALDLNFESGASEAIFDEAEKDFYCCCISQGMISATMSVPSSGFVPGQTIPITVHCDNDSSIAVTEVKVSLRQRLTFHATTFLASRTKTVQVVVMEEACGQPFPDNSENPVTVQLRVPQLPASNLENCRIIDLDYVLRVDLHFSGMHCRLVRCFPILIGTVPLFTSPDIDGSDRVTAPLPSAPLPPEPSISTGQGSSGISQFDGMSQPSALGFVTDSSHPSCGDPNDLPPPSYEECILGAGGPSGDGEADRTQGARTPSAPQYPVHSYGPTNGLPTAPEGRKS